MNIQSFVAKYDLWYDAKIHDGYIITTLGMGSHQFCIKSPHNELDEEILNWDTYTYIKYECIPRVQSYVNKRWLTVKTKPFSPFEQIWFQNKPQHLLTKGDINNYKKGIVTFIDILKEIFGQAFFNDLCEVSKYVNDADYFNVYEYMKPSLN